MSEELAGKLKNQIDQEMVQIPKEDLHRLVEWLDQVDFKIESHFRSWSWRIGYAIVRMGKALVRKKHPPVETYAIQQVLDAYRLWRVNKLKGLLDSVGDIPSDLKQNGLVAREVMDCSLLLGQVQMGEELDGICGFVQQLSRRFSIQVVAFVSDEETLGFLEERLESSGDRIRLEAFSLGSFPAFFTNMTQVLCALKGRQLVVCYCDLLSLGVGLLALEHFRLPLSTVFVTEDRAAPKIESLSASQLLDPTSKNWSRVLLPYALAVENIEGGLAQIGAYLKKAQGQRGALDFGVLKAAREFSLWFSNFYKGLQK